LIQIVQFEHREIVHSLGVMLASSSNVDDCPGHNLGYRIVTIEQLKGFANGLKRGVHGFDCRRLKNGSLQVGCQRHSTFDSSEFMFGVNRGRFTPWSREESQLAPELMPDLWVGVGNQGYQRTEIISPG
jgi:hypothetical protein